MESFAASSDRLKSHAVIVHSSDFEMGIVKIQDQDYSELNGIECIATNCLKNDLQWEADPDRAGATIAEKAIKRGVSRTEVSPY